ncbi:MAG: hypothetical protein E4H40_06410 [Candidatus Brocadiia bacterium]|nr:MAG: hypothetical protein E4H40_06410 [Candidatus Brocadiia bacterium]
MSLKKQYLYNIEAEKDGRIVRYSIFKSGRTYFIDEVPVHRSNCSQKGLKTELSVVFGAKFIKIVRDITRTS